MGGGYFEVHSSSHEFERVLGHGKESESTVISLSLSPSLSLCAGEAPPPNFNYKPICCLFRDSQHYPSC